MQNISIYINSFTLNCVTDLGPTLIVTFDLPFGYLYTHPGISL